MNIFLILICKDKFLLKRNFPSHLFHPKPLNSEFGLAIEFKSNNNLKLYAEYLTRDLGDYEVGYINLYHFSDNGFALRTGLEAGVNNVFRGGFFIQSVPIYKLIIDDEDYYYDDKYDDDYWRDQYSDEYSFSRIKVGCSLGYNF